MAALTASAAVSAAEHGMTLDYEYALPQRPGRSS